MSVTEQLKRIVTIRNGIRQKLMDFGLVQNTSKFQDCQNAIEGMRDNTKNTTVDNALQSVFHSGTRGGVRANGIQGYSSEQTLVYVPVANLSPENIKEGVNIGGVVGQVKEYKSLRASGGNDDYCFPTSREVSIKNDGTAEIEVSYYTSGWRTTSFDIKLY